jgi:hypothetical protein
MRRKQKPPASERTSEPAVSRLETITALAVVAIVALALAAVAWASPLSRSDDRTVTYHQSGAFAYDATPAGSSTVYGTDGVTTGDPILTSVVGPVSTHFTYRLTGASATHVHGSAQLTVVVNTAGGLTRAFPIAPASHFSGSHTTVTGQLPVRGMLAFVAQAHRQVGGTDTTPTTVVLTPKVTVHGVTHDQRFNDHFAPSLTFDVDGTTLTVAQPSGVGDVQSELHPTTTGTTTYPTNEAGRLSLGPLHARVSFVRVAGLGLAVFCGLLALWLARPLLRPRGQAGESVRIRALYGSRIVDVAHLSLHEGPVADVATMDALAELAKRYESMIMHVSSPEAYLVWDNGMLYRYSPVPVLQPVGGHVARQA